MFVAGFVPNPDINFKLAPFGFCFLAAGAAISVIVPGFSPRVCWLVLVCRADGRGLLWPAGCLVLRTVVFAGPRLRPGL